MGPSPFSRTANGEVAAAQRLTEGLWTFAITQDGLCDICWRSQHVWCRDTHHLYPKRLQNPVATHVTLCLITHVMCYTIDLEADLGGGAVEIEHVIID